MTSQRRSLVLLAFLLFVSACAGESPPSEIAFSDTSEGSEVAVDQVPTDPIVIENANLISFRARWVCELQRRTFSDLTDMDSALDDALVETDLSRAAYDDFVIEMADSQVLRDEVLRLYGEQCRA